ncbi:adenosylcobinamide-GDP ribazoletransferase [Sulfurovum sp.]|jgi:cobalamin 5'-phosphate synthase/cobalamin synthase|uniref:adenosylcobinamide-GDP ribazoletransferase n=1 Tax=Sulfurovum sp. TaxID=1969726 RepID=UPI002A35FF68|nr:adenosylcobinamide-GDP ribazoletransferase [Sulfurovum sp.]MDY0402923.1 adenosylcobinamide-GDP ribazoletransferase [Sulfurovum sp.]
MMASVFKGLVLAINMLTAIPFFKVHTFDRGINGYAVMFYPLVGLILGALLYLFYTIAGMFFPQAHVAVMVLVLWVMLTGALHLDGFADTVDGLYVSKERAFAVMKDPNIGAMGMIFTALLLLLKVSLLIHLEHVELLPLLLMLSRYNALLWIRFYPYLSTNGIGSLAKQEFTTTQLMISSVMVLVCVTFFQSWVLWLASFLAAWLTALFFMRRYGGFSGDIYGFGIEMSEIVLLHLLVLSVL